VIFLTQEDAVADIRDVFAGDVLFVAVKISQGRLDK